MYTDEVTLTVDTVLDCLHTSRKYSLDGLVQKCSDFLERSLSADNACSIYEQAKLYDMASLEEQSLDYILDHPDDVFTSIEFREISKETLVSILESSKLGVCEQSNFNAAVDWAEHQCDKNNVRRCSKNIRKYLGEALYHIRFPVIPMDVYAKEIAPTGILNSKEQLALYQYMATKQTATAPNVGKFTCAERKSMVVKVLETEYTDNYRSIGFPGTTGLIFEITSDLKLKEIKGAPGSSFLKNISSITMETDIDDGNDDAFVELKDWELRNGSIVFIPHLILHKSDISIYFFYEPKVRAISVNSKHQVDGVDVTINQIPPGLESMIFSK